MLWCCDDCTTRYAESLSACPHCVSENRTAAHEVDDQAAASTSAEPASEGGF